jgi:hypothetical protein
MLSNGLGTFRVAAFVGFNQPLGFAKRCGVDEDNDLLFGSWVKEIENSGFLHFYRVCRLLGS